MLDKLSKKQLFFILLGIEIIILILSVICKQIMGGMMMFIIRIALVTAAFCCESVSWSSLYSVFALLSALYSLDPVGLFITGHGASRTTVQNILCCLITILLALASYLGYIYTCAIQSDVSGGEGWMGANPSANNNYGYVNPNTEGTYMYNGGGTNFASISNPYGSTSNNNQHRNQFRPFSGQGYSLS